MRSVLRVIFQSRLVTAASEQKSVLFFPIFSHAREKIGPSETRADVGIGPYRVRSKFAG